MKSQGQEVKEEKAKVWWSNHRQRKGEPGKDIHYKVSPVKANEASPSPPHLLDFVGTWTGTSAPTFLLPSLPVIF